MSHYTRKLLIGTSGILISTLAISYHVEKLFSLKYKSNQTQTGDMFAYPTLVTWLGCLLCVIYGTLYAHYYDSQPNRIPLKQRWRLGALFTLNYLPTNYALLFISYPLQVIAKNTRYLLVVIIGAFFSRVTKNKELKLPKSKIYIAILITFGAGLFMFLQSDKKTKENHFHPEKKWIGFLLLVVAIIFDALFSDSQAYCKSTFAPTQNQLFLASNLYAFVLIFVFALLSGELTQSLAFCIDHPSVLKDLFSISLLQIVSQVSVYYVISNFKQHIYPLISTVRKVLTVFLSIFLFSHSVKLSQWFAIIIVFLAMGYELYDQIKSQEMHRSVRKDRMKEEYLKTRESQQQEQQQTKQKQKFKSPILIQQSKSSRRNYHMGSAPTDEQPKVQSLSKYGYGWRRSEVAENRQTSISPLK